MATNICPRCGAEIPKGEFRCPSCAIDIREWNPDKLRCPVCRELYPKGTKFCLKDGSPLEQAIVNFDSEATMFLSGSASPPPPKEDLIPRMRFAPEPERHVSRPEHLPEKIESTPAHLPKKPAPEVVMPDIRFDIATPEDIPVPEPEPDVSAKSRPDVPLPPREIRIPAPAQAPEVSPASKATYRIKPLEEYEKLIAEEEKRQVQIQAEAAPSEEEVEKQEFHPTQEQLAALKKKGFFHRLKDALRLLFGR